MIKILSKREKTILFTTIGVILFALCFNLIFAPFFNRNASLNREIIVTRSKLNKYIHLLKQKERIEGLYGELSSLAANGTGNPAVDALREIENLAKTANVKIIEVRPQGTRQVGAERERSIDMRCEASIESYFKFIYDLENSLSLLRIKSFQMTAKPNSGLIETVFQLSQLEM